MMKNHWKGKPRNESMKTLNSKTGSAHVKFKTQKYDMQLGPQVKNMAHTFLYTNAVIPKWKSGIKGTEKCSPPFFCSFFTQANRGEDSSREQKNVPCKKTTLLGKKQKSSRAMQIVFIRVLQGRICHHLVNSRYFLLKNSFKKCPGMNAGTEPSTRISALKLRKYTCFSEKSFMPLRFCNF